MSKQYYPFLDHIRVIASFLVVLLHAASIKFHNFSPAWEVYVIYDSISRMCVPLFFMLSGYLLLGSTPISLPRFYVARYKRIFIPFAMLACIYYFTPLYAGYTPARYALHILATPLDFHLWYIYALVGLYAALPFFNAFLQDSHARSLAALYICFWLAAGICAPFICRYWNLQHNIFNNFHFNFFSGFMGYFLCGWGIKRLQKRITAVWRICAGVCLCAASIGIIHGTISYSRETGAPNELFFENLTPLVFLQAISFFVLATGLARSGRLTRELSEKSFWIYLLHTLVMRIGNKIVQMPHDAGAWLVLPIYALLVFSISYALAIPMRAIEQLILRYLARLRSHIASNWPK